MDINAKKITIQAARRSLKRRRVVWVMASLSVNSALLSIENKRCSCYCPRREWWRSSSSSSRRYSVTPIIRCSADTDSMATQKLGIKVDRNPPESRLTQLGVRNWPKWGCPPSKFPWTYSDKETCYLLEGKVKVTPDGSNESVEIGAGDLVEFPKGMSCTWDVSAAVDKHYNFS